MQELKPQELKCKKCNMPMKRLHDIKFGSAAYKQFKCAICNTIEYQVIGVR
ncbi:hypothetical protein HZA96_03370 [Candidatus Woesearchaeota archaeon]|nr:hypothetical protein [Candidatus Woesearchaeota archaeon]